MKDNMNFNTKRLYTARFHNPNVGTIEVTVTSNNIEHYEDFCRLMSNVGLEVKDTKDWMDNWLQSQRDDQKTINTNSEYEFVDNDEIANRPVIKAHPPKDEYIVSVTQDGNNPWIDSHSIIWMDMSTAESFNKTYHEVEQNMIKKNCNPIWMNDECGITPCKVEDSIEWKTLDINND